VEYTKTEKYWLSIGTKYVIFHFPVVFLFLYHFDFVLCKSIRFWLLLMRLDFFILFLHRCAIWKAQNTTIMILKKRMISIKYSIEEDYESLFVRLFRFFICVKQDRLVFPSIPMRLSGIITLVEKWKTKLKKYLNTFLTMSTRPVKPVIEWNLRKYLKYVYLKIFALSPSPSLTEKLFLDQVHPNCMKFSGYVRTEVGRLR